ncbi:MAG: hypothetical protein SFX73_17010 [Kofleriaceae bacterium]|nr:hypothetical protein [Kofleriaceae bacterium]
MRTIAIPFFLAVVACAPTTMSADPVPQAFSQSAGFPAAPTIEALALAGTHVCALTQSRRVWCWSGEHLYAPRVATPLEIDDVVELVGRAGRTCARDIDGKVTCWRVGWALISMSLPAVEEIVLDDRGGCGRTASGTVHCWQDVAATTPRGSPWPALMGLSDVRDLASAGDRTCALVGHGDVACWGRTETGGVDAIAVAAQRTVTGIGAPISIGVGRESVWRIDEHGALARSPIPTATGAAAAPAALLGDGRTYASLAVAENIVCALGRDATLFCGEEAGRGARVLRPQASGVQAFAVSDDGTACAGTAEGWWCRVARGDWLALGPDQYLEDRVPFVVAENAPVCGEPPEGVPVVEVVSGPLHACARLQDGRLRCWGSNESGQIGAQGSRVTGPDPQGPGMGVLARAVAAGRSFTCAAGVDDSVWCWGASAHGQLGRRERARTSLPRAIGGFRVSMLAAGEEHACAIDLRGDVLCWGAGRDGRLGGGQAERAAPTSVPGVRGATLVTAGGGSTCAATTTSVACWGAIAPGGAVSTIEALPPGPVEALAVRDEMACATVSGAPWCWRRGALRAAPIGGMPPIRSLAAGASAICATAEDGTAYCWGDDREPARVPWLDRVVSMSVSALETCAVQESGGVCCWAAGETPHPVAW